ncbi:Zn-ribbon domain-containing OB-fold protein [Caballeronia sp. LZ001]|uniref:Zn-ribbon domain-containing OB-fold protein n=1 Tax=Caballeronia sp. LZ001 TaxID=3038553 RepID=UPI00285F7135|nr:Zn-ribbon domain-containing OB-fold protein [Caballeronia sp. LZ001]MDR5804851.1 Zn-ribbon domain-containing OB-fold protein [Caballeronia sp. LZ001]
MSTLYQDRPLSAPLQTPENRPYFEAASAGKLLVRFCLDCGKAHHYPRSFCPLCHSSRVEWKETSGRGTIYTYTVTRRVGPVPYALAYVTLDEGPTMMTNIVDCDLDSLSVGQPVKVTFKASEDGTAIPMFTPILS